MCRMLNGCGFINRPVTLLSVLVFQGEWGSIANGIGGGGGIANLKIGEGGIAFDTKIPGHDMSGRYNFVLWTDYRMFMIPKNCG